MFLKTSFPPIVDENSCILILGSLPGDLSIAKNEYYAHPQNRFWKIIFHLFEQPFSTDYSIRQNILLANRVALWDVCHSATRPGSMDAHITGVSPNAITILLTAYPNIQQVFFNGQKAASLFATHFEGSKNIHFTTLPSTSPANAQYSLDRLIQAWHKIKLS